MPAEPTTMEVSLTHASILFQSIIIFIIGFFFLTGWIITKRDILKYWTVAWSSDLLALTSVLMVVGKHEGTPYTRMLYTFYSFFKLAFIYFILLGFFQFIKGYSTKRIQRTTQIILLVAFATVVFMFFRATSVHIQATVFLTVGLLATLGAIFGLKEWLGGGTPASLILSLVLLLYGAVFLHHGIVLLPYFVGLKISGVMSRISFYDAGFELILGISFLTVVFLRTLSQLENTVKELEISRAKLRHLVDIDPLTGLYNRRKLRSFINTLKEKKGVIVFIDIDNFKKINDRWGHTAGDRCLRRISELLLSSFRKEDGIFRYGGDEFLVITGGPLEAVKGRVKRLKAELSKASSHHIPLSISVGISVFSEKTPFYEAFKKADRLMYEDKSKNLS